MTPKTIAQFQAPTNEYAMQPIIHRWPENYQDMVDALKECCPELSVRQWLHVESREYAKAVKDT